MRASKESVQCGDKSFSGPMPVEDAHLHRWIRMMREVVYSGALGVDRPEASFMNENKRLFPTTVPMSEVFQLIGYINYAAELAKEGPSCPYGMVTFPQQNHFCCRQSDASAHASIGIDLVCAELHDSG